MNTDDTLIALRLRRELTGESFNDGTIEAWTAALDYWQLADVRTAIVKASRTNPRVTVPHVIEHLPHRPRPGTSTQVHYPWDGPTDRGRAIAAQIRAHLSHECDDTCTICRPESRLEANTTMSPPIF